MSAPMVRGVTFLATGQTIAVDADGWMTARTLEAPQADTWNVRLHEAGASIVPAIHETAHIYHGDPIHDEAWYAQHSWQARP